MAEALTPAPARRETGRRSAAYGRRFALAYALLALVLAGAATALVLLLTRTGGDAGQAWSAWRPTGEGRERAREIARHVSEKYRLPSGKQLVAVLVGQQAIQNVRMSAIAVQEAPGGASDGNVSLVKADTNITYILCGLGARCSIDEGEPSIERARLLRRETLELALYTFRYIDDVESVVTFFPPRKGTRPVWAYFFRRSDLARQLERPLRDTLPAPAPPLASEIDPVEAARIDSLTERHRFQFQFQQAPDGSVILVLVAPPDRE